MAGPTGPTGPTGASGGGAAPIYNANSTIQLCTANTENYITGSDLIIDTAAKVKTRCRWTFHVTKTAAGTGVPQWIIKAGTGATITDTNRVTMTGVAQTAATDSAFVQVEAVFNAVGATAVVQGAMIQNHRNAVSGFQNVATALIRDQLSTPFTITPGNTRVGIAVQPGVSGVWTFQLVAAVAENTV